MLKNIFDRMSNKYNVNTVEPTTENCPNCGSKLNKIPDWKNGKMNCPHCANVIVVRTGELFTEDESNVRDWLERVNRLHELNITREVFNKTRLKLSNEFGFLASVNDTAWRILVKSDTPDKSFEERRQVYLAMEYILRVEGKNTKEIMAKAHEMDLLNIKELLKYSGKEIFVRISTCNDQYVCEECKKYSKMTFTIDEALQIMPIPNNCINDNCRCRYGVEFPD